MNWYCGSLNAIEILGLLVLFLDYHNIVSRCQMIQRFNHYFFVFVKNWRAIFSKDLIY